MKNLKFIIFAATCCATFAACSGDHGTSSGVDTAKTGDIGTYDVRTNIDTSKSTHGMGDATILDNTASGGTLINKDTTHMKVRSVTIAPSVAPAAAPAADTTTKK